MLNKFAKTEEDLLREQAEYLRNPRSKRIVNTESSSQRPPRSTFKYEDSPCIISPLTSKISERHYPTKVSNLNSDIPSVGEAGQPHVPVLGESIKDADLLRAADRLNSEKPRKRSLFARQLLAAKEGVILNVESDNKQQAKPSANLPEPLKLLDDIGPGAIRKQTDFPANELVRIHEANIHLLSQLTPEEIMREREAILSSAGKSVSAEPMDTEAPPQETESSVDTASLLASLGLESATSIPHMDVVEPEKLAWMQELPPSAKAPGTKVVSARFDLEGRVVPPEADVPMHLGLHHHGEEPERGGYTIDELFHLASSTQPNQRRIALSSLASALAASRRGFHATDLDTPSLLSSLLRCRPPGVCFLLRWALDRCVSEASRSSVAAGDGGVSVAIVGECLRALVNLLVDDQGEALLDEAFDWSTEARCGSINLSPSEITDRPYKFRLKVPAPETSDEGDPDAKADHADVMAADPVGCLFRETSLAARIGWMLSPGPALHFPPDAVAHAIPGLLITAARHSMELALLVFETPHLIASLMEHFLPLVWDDSALMNSDSLTSAYGVPLPRVLKLMRVLAQRSNTLRLALVNKWTLADRCMAYLCHQFDSMNKLVVLLKMEALRCLAVCLEEPEPPQRAVELTRSMLNELIAGASEVMSSDNTHEFALKISWMSFFSRTLVPKFSQNLSSSQLEVIRSLAMGMIDGCTLEAYAIHNSGKLINPSPVLINVTIRLLKALNMNAAMIQLRDRIFTGPTWTRVFNHFTRYQSVLTGLPKQMSQTSALSPKFTAAYTTDATDPALNYSFPKEVIFEQSEEGDPLSVLNVSCIPPCLPDLGMSVCLLYRGAWAPSNENHEAKTTIIPAMWWPPSSLSNHSVDVVEPLDLLPHLEAKWPNFLPLIEAALEIGGVDLSPWCDHLRRVQEKEIKADLWWTSFHLLSCLHFGQEALFIELLQKITFPIYDLTPIEAEGFSDAISNSAVPWPPIHESFSRGLSFYAHKLYGEYFPDLLQRRSSEMKEIYKPLKHRPSCDFILPDDWYYMPLLEAYFHHARSPTNESGQSKVYFKVDPETYLINATASLGWIRGLLHQQPGLLRKNPFPRGITTGGHFSRICCAILACQSAGALCFDAAGAIVAELVSLLVPRIDFGEVDTNPKEYLPLDLLSLYDLFTDLLEHYAAVSYSSPIFANLILLFLRPAELPAPNYRKALWGEHQAALRALQISPSEVFLPEDIYKGLFDPIETVEEVFRAYASALCSGIIHPNRQPLLFLVALHHLNRNIYLTKPGSTNEEFLKSLSTSLRFMASRRGTQDLIGWLRSYRLPSGRVEKVPIAELAQTNRVPIVASGNFKIEDLMELYEEKGLPPNRRKRWNEFFGK
ncbi:hypothetical protein Aperf_G00000051473 [Anoplocephala perfoliata]